MRSSLKIAAVVCALCAALAVFMLLPQRTVAPVVQAPAQATTTLSGPPAFSWLYREFEESGLARTEISLYARYEDGSSRTEIIDTVDGSCNEYTKKDGDVFEDTDMIQCYSAGLGQRYKVVSKGGAYLVQRKIFEEALPDQAPPVYEYETIAEF